MTPPALVTIVSGRHIHLRRQREWIAAMDPAPCRHVVVSMGDPEVAALAEQTPACPTTVVELAVDGELPLSAARNAGVRAAADAGAHTVALLDVDCLPSPSLAGDYADALARVAGSTGPSVVCGRVLYLPDGLADADHTLTRLAEVGRDHSARVVPGGDEPLAGEPRLLWSLNIALTVADWDGIGGFDERFVGYGGEDTDFGQRLAAAGGTMWWSRRATTYHQYHPTSSPPVQHAAAIARNVNLFRSLWGFEPMGGWLASLSDLGYLERTDEGWREVPVDEDRQV